MLDLHFFHHDTAGRFWLSAVPFCGETDSAQYDTVAQAGSNDKKLEDENLVGLSL